MDAADMFPWREINSASARNQRQSRAKGSAELAQGQASNAASEAAKSAWRCELRRDGNWFPDPEWMVSRLYTGKRAAPAPLKIPDERYHRPRECQYTNRLRQEQSGNTRGPPERTTSRL